MAHPVIHSLDIQSVVYSPSGETIISVDNKDVCFWDSDTGALLSIFKTSPLSSFCTSVAFSLDSKFFVTEYQDGSMLLRELATGASIATFNLNINYYPRGRWHCHQMGNALHQALPLSLSDSGIQQSTRTPSPLRILTIRFVSTALHSRRMGCVWLPGAMTPHSNYSEIDLKDEPSTSQPPHPTPTA